METTKLDPQSWNEGTAQTIWNKLRLEKTKIDPELERRFREIVREEAREIVRLSEEKISAALCDPVTWKLIQDFISHNAPTEKEQHITETAKLNPRASSDATRQADTPHSRVIFDADAERRFREIVREELDRHDREALEACRALQPTAETVQELLKELCSDYSFARLASPPVDEQHMSEIACEELDTKEYESVLDELKKLGAPLVEFIQKKRDIHTKVVISCDHVILVSEEFGVPFKMAD